MQVWFYHPYPSDVEFAQSCNCFSCQESIRNWGQTKTEIMELEDHLDLGDTYQTCVCILCTEWRRSEECIARGPAKKEACPCEECQSDGIITPEA